MPCEYNLEDSLQQLVHKSVCQFKVDENNLYEFNSRQYCQFHLPSHGKELWGLELLEKFGTDLRKNSTESMNSREPINFTGVVFPSRFSFHDFGIEFNSPSGTIFSNAIFSGKVDFHNILFLGHTDFDQCFFHSGVRFDKVTFRDGVNFSDSVFAGEFLFDQVIFKSSVSFTKCNFKDETVFSETKFNHDSFFEFSRFEDSVDLSGCIFAGYAGFPETIFERDLSLNGSIFGGEASFEGVINSIDEKMPYFCTVDFSGVSFFSQADFSNREFKSSTSFRNTIFWEAPMFHNCILHQDTDFSNSSFRGTARSHSARAYRTLKLAMEGHRARTEEAMFYALEQESIRHQPDTPFSVWVFSLLYQWGSDYGRNFVAPFGWLIYFALFFAFTYDQLGIGNPDAWSFTVQQYVRPFLVWGEAEIGVGVKLLASVQSLLGLGLGTLFVLAVRRRFRMG